MTKSILVSDQHVTSTVYASRDGIATATRIEDHIEGKAYKVSTTASFTDEADFVVQSVRNSDGRRKVVVLHGVVSNDVATAIPGFASIEENDRDSFGVESIIWMEPGDEPVILENLSNIVG